MKLLHRTPLLVRSLTLALLGGACLASTLTVDDDGGADFTEITDAIGAASHGDLILIEPGFYEDFTLSKGLTLIGTAPGVVVATGSRVSALPANRRAVLTDMTFIDLRVVGCSGPVILDGLDFPDGAGGTGLAEFLSIDGSSDVRLHETTVNEGAALAASRLGVTVNQSRAEVVSSSVSGDEGSTVGSSGVDGMFVLDSRAHVAASSVIGGRGADGNFATCVSFSAVPGGDGGPAISCASSAELFLMGGAGDLVQGGHGGLGDVCDCDGNGGYGLLATTNSSARYSGITLDGGGTFCFGNGSATGSSSGGSTTQASPAEPYLTKQFVPVAGGQVRFVIQGQPGDMAILYLGRSPIVAPTAGYTIEQLTTRERTFVLGPIGATGNATFLMTVPGNLPQGFSFFAQAEVVGTAETYHTNSVPVVLR